MFDIDYDLTGLNIHPESEPTTIAAGPLMIPEVVEEDEVLPALPKFSTQDVAVRMLQWEKDLATMEAEARGIPKIIKDEETNAQAARLGQRAKKVYKKLEELRQYFVRPHLDYQQEVNAFFKRVTSRLKAVDDSMGRLEVAYLRFKENQRRIKEAEAQKAADEQTALLAAEAEAAKAKGVVYEPVTVVAQVVPAEKTVTRTSEGSSSLRRKMVCRIVQPDLVPRKYCVPSQKLLDQDMDAGVREIPGCIIEEDASIVRRG